MKRLAAVVYGDGRVDAIEEEVPELKPGEVLVKVACTLISPGTEMNLPRNRRAKPDASLAPAHFGYSAAGTIVATCGDVKDLKVGMRVGAMGGGAPHASYACVPVNLVVPLPDEVTFEQATFFSLAATSLQAVRRTAPKLGEYGAVLGMGIVGNLAGQLYHLSGAHVLGWESLPLRREIAAKCAINTVDFMNADAVEASQQFSKPYGLDFALFAFGGNAEKSFMDIKKCMKVSADGHIMGRAVLVGGCRVPVDGGASTGNLDILVSSRTGAGYHDHDWEYGKDYPQTFVQFTSQRNAREIALRIARGQLNVDALVTHRLPIQKVADAAEMLLTTPGQALGVLLQMPE